MDFLSSTDVRCSSSRLRCRKARAFTLVELLAVIAIIGVLIAILIPVLGSIRESARATEDGSRLRACYGALSVFAAEHKGRMKSTAQWVTPSTGAWQADSGGGGVFMTWSNWLAGQDSSNTGTMVRGLTVYATDWNIFISPSVLPASYRPNGASPVPIYRTFGMFLGGTVAGFSSADWIQGGEHILSLVPMPARIPLLADTVTNDQGGVISGWGYYGFRPAGLYENSGIHLRYDDRANVVFYDGHTARLDRRQLADLGFTQAVDKDLKTVSLP
ncbi:MAG: type II secretion system protein [Opitutaceae bacterium]|jgi:prepilin-type N-terminal cleavage/methylation domain-containing protein/prepilin-type processing-associated H-X9-DG protein